MYESQRSSAFIQLTPRRESRTSDGLNTHQVDVHRAYASDEEASNGDKRNARNVVDIEPTNTSHLAPNSVGPRVDTEVDRRERNGDSTVVEYAPTHTLHLAHRRGANAERNADRGNVVDWQPTPISHSQNTV